MKRWVELLATLGPLGLMIEILHWIKVLFQDSNLPQLPPGLLMPLHIVTFMSLPAQYYVRIF
jgi:hypothetical protein